MRVRACNVCNVCRVTTALRWSHQFMICSCVFVEKGVALLVEHCHYKKGLATSSDLFG